MQRFIFQNGGLLFIKAGETALYLLRKCNILEEYYVLHLSKAPNQQWISNGFIEYAVFSALQTGSAKTLQKRFPFLGLKKGIFPQFPVCTSFSSAIQ